VVKITLIDRISWWQGLLLLIGSWARLTSSSGLIDGLVVKITFFDWFMVMITLIDRLIVNITLVLSITLINRLVARSTFIEW